MAAGLGADWQEKYAQFDRQAISAASLGQVHKATSHEGESLAVKLQYPDMAHPGHTVFQPPPAKIREDFEGFFSPT